MAGEIDYDNPCERAKKLTETYFRLIQGESEAQIQFLSNGKTRMVMYNKADLATLKSEMQSAQAECEAARGNRPKPRRFSPQFG